MCGVWGFVTGERSGSGTSARLKFVEAAAIAGILRGDDSTGAFMVRHGAPTTADWCKVAGTGYEWLQSKYTQERFTYDRVRHYRLVVGHNRSATSGKVSLDNAHPFQEGPITLVHNGTLDTTWGLKVEAVKGAEVDSHIICHNLAQHPWKDVLPALSGAFALIWHDARDDGLYMVRNTERPLHLMRAKCEDTVLFASEPDMLWWLAGRSNFTRGDIVSLDSGVVMRFMPGSMKPEYERVSLGSRYSSYAGAGQQGKWKARSASSSAPTPPSPPPLPPEAGVPTAGLTKRGRAMLDAHNVPWKTPVEFSVDSIVKTRGQTCTVNGWAYFPGANGTTEAVQALIHGINHPFAQRRSRDDWYVRPVAVQKVGMAPKEKLCLICRLVRVSDAYSPKSSARNYIGPSGAMIPAERWLQLTRSGCCKCKRTLDPTQAHAILWMADDQPMCADCADSEMLKGNHSVLN